MAARAELDSKTERCLIDMAGPAYLTARQVRARAYHIVSRHAVRLGLDSFAASSILAAINGISCEGDV